MNTPILAGIDFGSKLAGTTAVAVAGQTTIRIFSSKKNQDADEFLMHLIEEKKINKVFIDAPLSIPGVYSGINGKADFFYRACDRELKAMSPMFLGGLTARAMKLCHHWKNIGIECIEVYPTAFIAKMGEMSGGYKSNSELIGEFSEEIADKIGLPLLHEPGSWHEVDALIALAIGISVEKNQHSISGNPAEGIIIY